LGSVVELKKAIKELKTKTRKVLGLETEGNRGFLIKDGRPTSDKIRIEVVPAPYQSLQYDPGPAKTKE
jgi:hypothetical protein